jgi:hypothetical protein
MDCGETERVGQIVLNQATIVAAVRGQTDDLQALPELDQQVGDALQGAPSPEVDQVLDPIASSRDSAHRIAAWSRA